MKLIDDYCLKLLKELDIFGELNFTGFNTSIKNKKTRSDRLKFLLEKKILVQKYGLYKMTEQGKNLLKVLKKAEEIIQEEKIFENYDRLPYLFRNYIYNYVSILKENINDRLLSVILFGSVARGKWTHESDIDLFLIFSNEISDKKQLNKILTNITTEFEKKYILKNEYKEIIYCPIQDFPLLLKDLSNFRTLFYDIAVDGIIIYDKKKIGLKFIKKIGQRIKDKFLERVFISDKNFYWKRKDVQFGEIIEL